MLLGLALHLKAGAVEPTALSWDEARSTLQEVSDSRHAGEAAVDRSRSEARVADALGLPDLSVDAIQVFGIKDGTIPGTPLGDISFRDNFKGPRSSVNTTWSIYSGGRITATQKALAAGVEAARAELSHTDEDLDVVLARLYFGLELAANVERTRSSVLEQANRQLDRALRFEQQGLIARVERLTAQVARDEAAREQVRAQRDREIAEANLRRLLHRDGPMTTRTPLFVCNAPLKPLADWLQLAEHGNPTLATLAARLGQAEQGVAVAESRWKPEIFAFGTYNMIRKYQTLIEPDWIAGVGVSFKLFSHEDRASQVSAARASVRQVESLQAAASTGIATEIESAYRKVDQAREQFKLLESSIALAEESQRLRVRGFEEGQATSLDVSEARDALARVQTARALAAYEFVIALAELLHAAGQTHTFTDFIQQADVRLPP
ncbi:MAG TPA: TolC family protein [Solirubrobacteraceae bacterium]|nr:TolC family protein [Solirubrobacteraceae bacterium]